MLLDAQRNLKIADFGVARVEAQNPKDMTGETGTLGYMAPEVLISVFFLCVCLDLSIILITVNTVKLRIACLSIIHTAQALANL